MHAGRHYSFLEVLVWTRRETLVFAFVSIVPPVLFELGVDVAFLPWPPVAVLGIAVAFVTGFKSNAAYGRLWEARQIWGAIVNASRAWGVMVRDFVATDQASHRRFVLRHIGWLTALRFQLRERRAWETADLRDNAEYATRTSITVSERHAKLDEELAALLSPEEVTAILAKKNRAAALLALQSEALRAESEGGRVTELRHIELVRMIATLFEQQGKCERIKNFPYPRQFATLNMIFVWMFVVLLPFGVVTELKRLGHSIWLTVPLTMLVSWVFHTMDKIGDVSENPFEGGPNDVPITAMSRGIEIDLRDMMNEKDLPPALVPTRNILL